MADLAKHIATQAGSAKAWWVYDDNGAANTKKDFNVTSISDDAVGRFTVTIANNMASGNYSVSGSMFDNAGSTSAAALTIGQGGSAATAPAAGTVEFEMEEGSSSRDSDHISGVATGDLA